MPNYSKRAVFAPNQMPPPPEYSRYSMASDIIKKNKIKTVLEIGCSNGFGYNIMKNMYNCDIDYTGIDIHEPSIEEAKKFYPSAKFGAMNILDFLQKKDHYDLIICYETLEHLDEGVQIAQRLKQYCNMLLVSMPYMEITEEEVKDGKPGVYWGPYHKLHHLNETHLPGFEKLYLANNGNFSNKPEGDWCLIIGKWTRGTNTVEICTRDRTFTTLPMAVQSVLAQTKLPEKIIIYFDGKPVDITKHPLWVYITNHIRHKNVQYVFSQTQSVGQVKNHEAARILSTTDLIYRLDDDEIMEPDVLEKLHKVIMSDEQIGAVGPLVLNPNNPPSRPPSFAKNKIEEINFFCINLQWFRPVKSDLIDVDHLHSSFLYRVSASSPYCDKLSIKGHMEESMFSYEIKRNGFKVLVDPKSVVWHYRNPEGGIRSHDAPTPEQDSAMFASDEMVFREKIKEWGIKPKEFHLISSMFGIGDSLLLRSLLPEIQKYQNRNLIIVTTHPEIFDGYEVMDPYSADIGLKSIGDNLERYNAYNWCSRNNWQGTFKDAIVEMNKPSKVQK